MPSLASIHVLAESMYSRGEAKMASDDLIFGAEIVLFLAAAGWSARLAALDARRRGKSPILVCILVVVFFPLGALAWLLFRPNRIETKTSG